MMSDVEPGDAAWRESLVVVEQGDSVAGLVVDDLLGQVQIVVKPLGRQLQAAPGISGSTVLGDGRWP